MSMASRGKALDFVAGCLHVDAAPDQDDALRAAIQSGDIDWDAVTDIVRRESMAPALWAALSQRGFAACVPSEPREQLWKAHFANLVRNRGLRGQALAVIQVLNRIGVQPTVLKGAATLFTDTYVDHGCRVMADLDILVPDARAEECWHAIRERGFVPSSHNFDYSNHHHLRPLHRESTGETVEVHRALLPAHAAPLIPREFIDDHIEWVTEAGAVFTIPDPAFRVIHIVVHGGVIDRGFVRGSLSLRALHELAILQSARPCRVDWTAIRELAARGGQEDILVGWLYLAHELLGSPMPASLRPSWKAIVHARRVRAQDASPTLSALVGRIMCFSRQEICERYECDDDLASITSSRIRLAATLARQDARRLWNWSWRASRDPSA